MCGVERNRHRTGIALVRVVHPVGAEGDRHERLVLRDDGVGNPVVLLGRAEVEVKSVVRGPWRR